MIILFAPFYENICILTTFYAELVGDGERVAKFLYIEHTFLFDL